MDSARLAGLLLVAGGAVFFVLGFGILPFQRGTPFQKRWVATWFGLAIALTAVAFYHLAFTLGDEFARSGLAAYALGAPVMFVVMVGYGTLAVNLPATDHEFRGDRTDLERALEQFSEGLYVVYMVLAFVSIALVGCSILRTGLLPAWMGWFSLAFGGLMILTFPLKFVVRFWIADLPLWIHVWALVIGVPLLLQ